MPISEETKREVHQRRSQIRAQIEGINKDIDELQTALQSKRAQKQALLAVARPLKDDIPEPTVTEVV